MRRIAAGLVVVIGFGYGTSPCAGADLWGGSLAVTSDYIVRGISRSNRDPALQMDLHYLSSSGLTVGLFASNSQIDPGEPKDVELDGFLGYIWSSKDNWQGRVLLSHYAYPWNRSGSGYDYDEFSADVAYQNWLDLSVVYSPNAPRYLPSEGLLGVRSESIELSLQRPVLRQLSATAGVGYSDYGGQYPEHYAYWSAGLSYRLAPVTLNLSYVNTSSAAKALFYNDAERNRWTGTVIWRF